MDDLCRAWTNREEWPLIAVCALPKGHEPATHETLRGFQWEGPDNAEENEYGSPDG